MNTKTLTFLFLLFTSFLFSQNIEVKGVVTDQNNDEPLPGVNIIIKGTAKGTSTDFDGNFVLSDVPINSVLVFSYLGYKVQEITILDSDPLNVALQEDAQSLDEVVVIGY
ncbi:MAG TPA: carboxypeptidase-like regulatory domain-containing protein, partial [Flavobacteriaceae bacterium]|nr:carboxypeptidase-like regulatory domain-containing protein [Flavobacteriaceae bacterium]